MTFDRELSNSRCADGAHIERNKEAERLVSIGVWEGLGDYCMTRLAACASFGLQSQVVSTREMWHQKLSNGPDGGVGTGVGLAGTGSGVFMPALITIRFRVGV